MTKPLIELCVEGIDGFLAAQEAGADRVELCASLMEGGLTPSLATIRAAVKAARIPVHVIIRPRGGDFLYSQAEFETMVEDIKALRSEGVAGVVIGCLTPDGRIDEARTKALVEAARPMSVTCHRAFDMTQDAREALEALIRCGVDRVLTSGGAVRSIDGVDTLARMVATRGDVEIMASGGIRTEDIPAILATGVQAVHLSARGQAGLDAPAGPGGGTAGHDITDPALVVAAVNATRG